MFELIICGLITAGLSAVTLPFIYCAFHSSCETEPENIGWGSHDWGTFSSQEDRTSELESVEIGMLETITLENLA